MLRRAICFVLFLVLLAVTAVGFAAKAPAYAKAVAKPGDKLLAAVRGASTGPVELTQIRTYLHTDAVTGAGRLRIVVDTTGPVELKSSVAGLPTPRLNITVKKAVPGQTECEVELDGGIADSVNMISEDGQNTVITVEMPLMPEDGDYKVFTLPADPANKKPYRIVIDVNQPMPAMKFKFTAGLKDKLIVIDPGHGGSDPGAVGLGGTTEKSVNLAVAQRVKALLDKAGAKVVMTHSDDRDVFGPNASDVEELKARATVANVRKADLFVSIHSNASVSRDADGSSTYFYQKSRYDSMLARNIQTAIIQTGGLKDRGAMPANFYVIKRTIMPAALVEMAFLSNPGEERMLANPQFQQKMAEGIVLGMERFFAQAAKMGGGQ